MAVALSGCGTIAGNANAAVSGSLVASTNTLSFGSVPLGQTATANVSLKNESVTSVQISQVSVTGQFSVAQNTMPVTVAAGGTYSISVQFAPTAVGTATGSLTLTSNASSGNPTVSLSGTGAADATPTPTAPGAMISPAPGTELSGSSVAFTWSAGSGVTEYQLWLGTTGAGSQNLGLYTEAAATGNTVSATATGLPTDAATVYVRLLSEIGGSWLSTDYTYTAASVVSTPTITVSAVSCSDATITGAGTDVCTVTLNSAASSDGATISLSSSDAALTVPSSVIVGANRSSATFTAIASAVSTSQNATITATVGTSSATYALQLNPQPVNSGTAALSLSAGSLAFGDVTINTQATPQSVTLISSGTAPLTINSATVTGAGFTMAGPAFPVTLNPGNSITLQVKFAPTTAGALTGSLTVVTNAPTNGTAVISLSGTGDAVAGALNGLFCQSGTIMGAGSDSCTVTLSAAAPAGGLTINLSSSNTALSVPATVAVPAGGTGAFFTATATSVTSTETANVIATAGGISKIYALQLEANSPALSVSTNALTFGDVTVNTPTTESVTLTSSGTSPLTINAATLTGTGFSMSGATFPVTLNAGQSLTLQVRFDPTTTGEATGSITVTSNATTNGTQVISLSGTGQSAAGQLSGLSCANGTITGATTDACTVSLSAAAPTGGLVVPLASSSSSVTVPASATVPAGAQSAGFTATVSAVTSTQTATLTATSSGTSKVFSLQLNPQTVAMSLSTNNLSFGNVNLNTSTSQTVTLTSSGTAALTINSATLTGTGFTLGGATFPATLNPGQTATLQITFDPTTAGPVSGSILITSNATTNPTAVISLSGTGDAPASTLSSLTCTTASYSAAGTDACTVTLSAAAPTGGQAVTLASSNAAVTVPASVTVAAGATTAPFTATIAAVTSTQSATLTATAGGASKVFSLQLNGQTVAMSLSTNSLAFGDVTINTSTSQSVTVTSSGTAALTINSATLTGTGFTLGGATFPATLNPGQTATLQVTFDPTTAGAKTGSILIATNATTNPNATISLSGTGDATTGTLSSLTCTTASYSAAGTDACTVTLSAAAPAGGQAVTLASSNAAVTVPASVTVAAGATTAPFTATIAAVTSTQSATLTATAGGASKVFSLQLNGQTVAMSLSTNSLTFGNVNLNTSTSQTVTITSSGTAALTINAAALTGTGFTLGGATFPVTLNPGQTATLQVTFDPTTAGAVTGSILVTSNAPTNPTATISLSGTGNSTAGALSSLSCATMSYNAAGTDTCTVTLSAAAPTGGLAVTLASNNSSVTVPASVTVAAGATTAPFTATIAAVTSTQTATLTATASGVAKTVVLQLSAGAPGLTLGSTSVTFGNVNLNTPTTQTVTLTSSGGSALTISAGTLTGTGFTMSGVAFPATLNPGQTATLDLVFDPTTAGAATGLVTITSNASTGATATIALSGTGVSATAYEVQLTWDAPTDTTDPAVGYNVYRSTSTGSFQLLNTSVNTPTSYTDTTVQDGTTYTYQVTSVDASGVESAPSNVYTAAIP